MAPSYDGCHQQKQVKTRRRWLRTRNSQSAFTRVLRVSSVCGWISFLGSRKGLNASRPVSESVSTRSARRRYRRSAASVFRYSHHEIAFQIGLVATSY